MINVGLFFGSKSVEHEISIITAHQVLNFVDKNKYNIIPIYITKDGKWLTGKILEDLENFKNLERLEKKAKQISSISAKDGKLILHSSIKKITIDVCLLTFHGSNGEDGSIQGMLEFLNVPYTGCGMYSSMYTMDKVITKLILKEKNIPVVDFLYTNKKNYTNDFLNHCKEVLEYPMIVKPARLGSSIGVKKVNDKGELEKAIEVAFSFDEKVIVEKWIDSRELNCAVMGYKNIVVSEIEEIKKQKDFFDYNEKYVQKGKKFSNHIIPAPIDENLKNTIKSIARDTFNALECHGNIRIDFLLSKDNKIYVNEVNSIPGALSYYLWQMSGFTFSQVIDNMISIAFEAFKDKKSKIYSIDTNLFDLKVEK
ncbi:MAG TPA: D-alanine--D-alanine ligase [Thermosipho africanus]|jgi:D-alanine-D-alanine ligase|nr:D-alanine--D-alanine ligase [Thermosipho africanus]